MGNYNWSGLRWSLWLCALLFWWCNSMQKVQQYRRSMINVAPEPLHTCYYLLAECGMSFEYWAYSDKSIVGRNCNYLPIILLQEEEQWEGEFLSKYLILYKNSLKHCSPNCFKCAVLPKIYFFHAEKIIKMLTLHDIEKSKLITSTLHQGAWVPLRCIFTCEKLHDGWTS